MCASNRILGRPDGRNPPPRASTSVTALIQATSQLRDLAARSKSASVKQAALRTAGNAVDGLDGGAAVAGIAVATLGAGALAATGVLGAGTRGAFGEESLERAASVLPPGSTRPLGQLIRSTFFWNASIAAIVLRPIFPSTLRAGNGAQLLLLSKS